MLSTFTSNHLPRPVFKFMRGLVQRRRERRFAATPKMTQQSFRVFLEHELGIVLGCVAFVHTSTRRLNLDFSFFAILPTLLDLVGSEGTLLFPATHLHDRPEKHLMAGEVFDVKHSPTTMGIVNELARRRDGACRSAHPTSSVAAIGPLARELTAEHGNSVLPCGPDSPYYKITEHGGIIVGLGVSTESLTFVHCVEDVLGERFPIITRPDTIYDGRVRCADGTERIVRTQVAHPRIQFRNLPRYMRRHVAPEICRDITHHGMSFFVADARWLFDRMCELAAQGVTIYSRLLPKRRGWSPVRQ